MPHICSPGPAGIHHIEDLYYAGGIPGVMKVLAEGGLLQADELTVSGKTVGETLAEVKDIDYNIIRPLDNPYHKEGGLAVLKGNIAPRGAI